MDYDKFDNDADGTSDEDYFAFVVWLKAQTATELQAAKGKPEAEKHVLCRYW